MTHPKFDFSGPAASPLGQTMPCNLEVEQALLGCVLYDAGALEGIDGLEPRQFSEPFHQRLFDKVLEHRRKGKGVHADLLASAFEHDAAFEELGGVRYLADLVDRAPPTAYAPDYAREVREFACRRSLVRQASDLIARAASDHEADASEIIAEAERQLAEIADTGAQEAIFATGAGAIAAAIDHAEAFGASPEFPLGLADLDAVVNGLQRGELTILAGRPGSGKTLVGLGFARSMASAGIGIAYFSLEMSEAALGLRLGCDVAFQRGSHGFSGPTMAGIQGGRASRDHMVKLQHASELAANWPLKVDCRAGLTVARIEQAARRQHREWARGGIKPGPVFVDHLGLVRPERDRQGSRHAEVADISRALAAMAKSLNVPVVALCQLNRGVEGREDKRPLLSDLRQAGELEEDARVVLLLHRPAYYFRPPEHGETFEQEAERLAREERDRNVLNIIVGKNSHGPTGEVRVFVDVARSAVRDW